MVDALAPAVTALKNAAHEASPPALALRAAASAAADGAEQTVRFVARFGKATALHERSLGHPDPGAISVTLIFTAMADWAEGHLTTPSADRLHRSEP